MNKFKSIFNRILAVFVNPKRQITYIVHTILGKDAGVSIKTKGEENVLLGSLKNPRQLAVCIKNKFYHIPSHLVDDRIKEIEYVAIYQSRNFFGRMAGIRYYGRVKKTAKVPRYKIKELPKNSDESYYRFDVYEWKILDERIEAKDIGFVHEFTSYDKLITAKIIPDLFRERHTKYEK